MVVGVLEPARRRVARRRNGRQHAPAGNKPAADVPGSAHACWTAGEGVFRLAAVRDAFSHRIVGWKTSVRCDTDLVLGAPEYAIRSQDVREGQLIHHSDRGSTYTAIRFAERLADNGILPSTGSVGDSYDNALTENFFSTLKIERDRLPGHQVAEPVPTTRPRPALGARRTPG